MFTTGDRIVTVADDIDDESGIVGAAFCLGDDWFSLMLWEGRRLVKGKMIPLWTNVVVCAFDVEIVESNCEVPAIPAQFLERFEKAVANAKAASDRRFSGLETEITKAFRCCRDLIPDSAAQEIAKTKLADDQIERAMGIMAVHTAKGKEHAKDRTSVGDIFRSGWWRANMDLGRRILAERHKAAADH